MKVTVSVWVFVLLCGIVQAQEKQVTELATSLSFADSVIVDQYSQIINKVDSLEAASLQLTDSLRASLAGKLQQADSLSSASVARLEQLYDSLALDRISSTLFGREVSVDSWKEYASMDYFQKFQLPGVSLATIPQIPTINSLEMPELPSVSSLEEITGMEGLPNVQGIDSLSAEALMDQGGKALENYLSQTEQMQYLQEATGEMTLPDEIPVDMSNLPFDQGQVNKLKGSMVSKAKTIVGQHTEKIQAIQSQAAEMKAKYSKVPDSEDLRSAVKQTSLEEESLGSRIQFGGNFNITKANPFSIDLSPTIGYRFNKLFQAGIGGMYRTGWKGDSSSLSISSEAETVYGVTLYAAHMAYKSFFGYVEGQYINQTFENDEFKESHWSEVLLIGIGRHFNISRKVGLQVMVLYNVLQDDYGPYERPIQIKTGIGFHK